MYLVSSIMYMAVEKVGKAWHSLMSTSNTFRYEALPLNSLYGQHVKSHDPKSLIPAYPLGFHHASSTETLYSRYLISSLLILQNTAPAYSASLRPFLPILAPDSSCAQVTCSGSSSSETRWNLLHGQFTWLSSFIQQTSLIHSANIYCDPLRAWSREFREHSLPSRSSWSSVLIQLYCNMVVAVTEVPSIIIASTYKAHLPKYIVPSWEMQSIL